MFTNYVKVAWRNLVHNKSLAVIKLAGLSIGLCVCMLILLYTKDELSYDRFHANSDRIFRVTQEMRIGNDVPRKMAITQPRLGPAFKEVIPEVQAFVRITSGATTIKQNNEVFNENLLFADENFLSVFSFELIEGNANTALKDDHSVVLSEAAAKKYFGGTDVIGKTMQLKMHDDGENFTVTAVVKNSPENSSLKFSMVIPAAYLKFDPQGGWGGGSVNTFLLLSPNANVAAVENKMHQLYAKNVQAETEKFSKQMNVTASVSVRLQPFTDIHLNTELGPVNGMSDGSNPRYSYVLSVIAIFVLLIACINFINLAIAQSLKRSKEIGIRKVMGGTRRQLIWQFLAESLLVSILAFALAFFLTFLLLPWFNELANKKLSLSYLSDGRLYLMLFLLLMITSFIAGFYPSLVLSRFQPVKVLYKRQKLLGKNYLTRGLVVLQFALAIFLIIGTFAMNRQVDFVLKAGLGFDNTNLVRVKMPFGSSGTTLAPLFRNELDGKSGILATAVRNRGITTSGVTAGTRTIILQHEKIDHNYLTALKITLIAGRNFSPQFPADSTNAVIVNESFLRSAGWKLEEAVGKTVRSLEGHQREQTIVGVTKDFHFKSMREKITPLIFSMDEGKDYGEVYIKISPDNIPQSLALIRNAFNTLVPFYPYEYHFVEDLYAANYGTEIKGKQTVSIASAIFVFISCIGLLGLAMLSVEQRTKEIGIRKVLGASVSGIFILISRQFLLLIVVAFVLAVPLANYMIGQWLQDFAYRTSMGWWIYALPGLIAVALALVTLCFQSIKAAIANPVKSLRTE